MLRLAFRAPPELTETYVRLGRRLGVEMVPQGEEPGLPVLIARPLRFLPSIQVIKANLDAGRLGLLGLLRCHRWEPQRGGEWSDNTQPLLDQLRSDLDLACWLAGQPPRKVFAVSQQPDYVQVHLGFAGGGMALLDLSRSLPGSAGYFSLSVIGSTGAAYADDHHDVQLLFGQGLPHAVKFSQREAAILGMLKDFVTSMHVGGSGADFGVDHLVEAVRHSLTTGQVVNLPGGAPP